jgi:hypothetical protein
MSTATTKPSTNDRQSGLGAAVYESIADLGAVVIRWVEILGDMTIFTLQTFSWLLARLPRRETLVPAFYNIGVPASRWSRSRARSSAWCWPSRRMPSSSSLDSKRGSAR